MLRWLFMRHLRDRRRWLQFPFALACLWTGLLASAWASGVEKIPVYGIELVDFVSHPEQGIDQQEVIDLAFGQLATLGYRASLDELHGIADALTRYMRERGLQFSYAYLPEQRLDGGTLQIRFVEGKLGDIKVLKANSDGERDALSRQFDDLLGEPIIQDEFEERMRWLQAEPNLDVFGYFSRGSAVGESRLNLRVKRFEHWMVDLSADNYGTSSTGRYRTIVQATLFNPANRLDTLSLGVLHTFGRQNAESNTYGFLGYDLPLWNLNHRLGLSVGNNLFQVGGDFAALDLEGDARTASMEYSHRYYFGNRSQQFWGLTALYKTTDFSSVLNDPLLEQDEEIRGGSLFWRLFGVSRSGQSRVGVAATHTGGEYQTDGVTGDGKESFHKEELSFSGETAVGWGKAMGSQWRLTVRGQYTIDPLPVSEQASFSGAYAVRSIEAGFFGADRIAIANAEWRLPWLLPAPGSGAWRLTPLLIADAGYGEKLNPREVSDRVNAWGWGVGLEGQVLSRVQFKVLALDLAEAEIESRTRVDQMDVLAEVSCAL